MGGAKRNGKEKILVAVFLVASLILSTAVALCVEKEAVSEEQVYFFYSDYCPHCRNVKPLVDEVAKKIDIVYCNVDGALSSECSKVAEENGIYAVPTLVAYGEEKKVYVGEGEVRSFLEKILS